MKGAKHKFGSAGKVFSLLPLDFYGNSAEKAIVLEFVCRISQVHTKRQAKEREKSEFRQFDCAICANRNRTHRGSGLKQAEKARFVYGDINNSMNFADLSLVSRALSKETPQTAAAVCNSNCKCK